MKKALITLVMLVFFLSACGTENQETVSNGGDIVDIDNHAAYEFITSTQGEFNRVTNRSIDLDELLVNYFRLTSGAALEIGSAIIRHLVDDVLYLASPPVVNDDDEKFIVSQLSILGHEVKVELSRVDAQILRAYNDGDVTVIVTQELALEIGDAALRLVHGERIFDDSFFRVTEIVLDSTFAVSRIPRTIFYALDDGEVPIVIIDSINGRIKAVGYW